MSKAIKLHFHPYNIESNQHVVEKAEGGKKRRYMVGIASGIKEDWHEERMTDRCIKGFLDQANSKELLLYPDVHGIRATEDIGRLVYADVMKSGDWYIENRLYDPDDEIGPVKLEKIDTLWKQVNGLPPYEKKIQKGFSIEGIIPDDQVKFGSTGKRVIDWVDLDGEVVVPRPAYKDSIVTAVYKALNEVNPYVSEKLIKSIQSKFGVRLQAKELQNSFYTKRYELNDILDEEIENIMQSIRPNKGDLLKIIFGEYSEMMIQLILQSESVFSTNDVENMDVKKSQILTSLKGQLKELETAFKRRVSNG